MYTKQQVLDSIVFWDGSNWTPALGYNPATPSASDAQTIIDTIGNLYDNSPTAKGILESIISNGPIRISVNSQLQQAYFHPRELSPGGIISDPYINLNPNEQFTGITSLGDLFQMSFDVIVAHELAHWANGSGDPILPPVANDIMNGSTYDYVGDTVRTEWQVSIELGLTDLRATYQTLLRANDPRLSKINQSSMPFGGYAEIVRFGDRDHIGNTLYPDDNINLSARTDGRSALLFGFSGNDKITGTSASLGVDYLYGGDGNDWIFGGMPLTSDPLGDVVYGEDGNDVIIIGNSHVVAFGGAGDDKFFIRKLESSVQNSSINFMDLDSGDSIYWNGYIVSGGQTKVLDFEWSLHEPMLRIGDVDQYGIVYIMNHETGVLSVFLPDGNIFGIESFTNGLAGIYIDPTYSTVTFDLVYDQNDVLTSYSSNVEFSGIEMSGVFEDYYNLTARLLPNSSIGPVIEPTGPVI